MAYALVKDNVVFNVIVWDGPGENNENAMDFGEGVEAVFYDDNTRAGIGFTYKDGVFTPPPQPELTQDEKDSIEKNLKEGNSNKKRNLLDQATQMISILQDAIDFEMATQDEIDALPLWKKYRILLSRVDADTVEPVTFPDAPKVP